MTNHTLPKYSVVDLFAGAGGLSYGFLQTNRFHIKAAFEMNTNAQKTYLKNHGNDISIYSDVNDALTEEIKEKLGKVDVVIGGPPCQGFSNANRQKNHVINQNNSLIKKYVQAILHLNPTAFVMENVSMLQSDTHIFYVDKNDAEIVNKYKIKTSADEIKLLNEEFMFDNAINVINNIDSVKKYLWLERDYISLNIIYKIRNSNEKLKKALKTHKKRLLALAETLKSQCDNDDYIIRANSIAGDAISRYYEKRHNKERAIELCNDIEKAIMVQRMLSKAKEVFDNNIKVSEYSNKRGVVAHVSTMAVSDYIESILGANRNGYALTKGVLSAVTFGIPQKRMRYVIMGVKKSVATNIDLPIGTYDKDNYRTVRDAIEDIENIVATTDVKEGSNGTALPKAPRTISDLGKQLRNSDVLYNHISTETTDTALERFEALKPGENFHSLPAKLRTSYSNADRTQNSIYLRLDYDEPSGTVVNVRKSMWIHPVHNRAVSIREAARLQTFPDNFIFCGTKDSQYQQVGNAVPPMLACALAKHLCGYLDSTSNYNYIVINTRQAHK